MACLQVKPCVAICEGFRKYNDTHTYAQMMSTAGEGAVSSEVGDHSQTSLSWYVTRPTQPPPSTGWEMSGQGVIAVLPGHKGISTEGLNGLKQGDECSSMASFHAYAR